MIADSYVRKPSAEEAREGYLMVLKDRLDLFPPIGQPFDLRDGTTVCQVSVEADHCECRGPDKPHDHYRITVPGLVKGAPVTITRTTAGYELAR